jgi:hypothetical protein
MTKTGHDHYNEAVALRNRIVSGQSNEPAIQAWAAVCRACAKANDAYRAEFSALSGGMGYTRFELAQLDNLGRVWWWAKAQIETIRRAA